MARVVVGVDDGDGLAGAVQRQAADAIRGADLGRGVGQARVAQARVGDVAGRVDAVEDRADAAESLLLKLLVPWLPSCWSVCDSRFNTE